jgi:hypothetical protein
MVSQTEVYAILACSDNCRSANMDNMTICISVSTCQWLQKRLFPTRPSSISLKIGIVRDLSKKQRSIFNSGQKASKKKLQGCQIFYFPRFLNHIFFDNSTSFYCKNLCLGALESLFITQNSKNKKKQQQQFFSKKNLVSMT